MKTLKRKIFLVLFAVLSFTAVQAQDKKVEFGLSAGYGYTMPRVKTENNVSNGINTDNLSGFHVGPLLKFNVDEQFSFQTGLLFNYFSGIKLNSSLAMKKLGTWDQTRTKLMAFDLPFRVMYSAALAEDFYFFVFAGPNLNYSLNKISTKETYVDKKLFSTIPGVNIYEKPTTYKAFDLQLGAGLGVQWMGVSLRGSYDWGLLNRTTIEKMTLRSNDLKVTLGYTF